MLSIKNPKPKTKVAFFKADTHSCNTWPPNFGKKKMFTTQHIPSPSSNGAIMCHIKPRFNSFNFEPSLVNGNVIIKPITIVPTESLGYRALIHPAVNIPRVKNAARMTEDPVLLAEERVLYPITHPWANMTMSEPVTMPKMPTRMDSSMRPHVCAKKYQKRLDAIFLAVSERPIPGLKNIHAIGHR